LFLLINIYSTVYSHTHHQSFYSYSEKSNKMQQCIKILLFLILNEAQHVSGDTPPISKSLKLHKQLLVLHTWKVVGSAVVGRCHVAWLLASRNEMELVELVSFCPGLFPLAGSHRTCMTCARYCTYSLRLLMIRREDRPKHVVCCFNIE
jgi:hypothetical protein